MPLVRAEGIEPSATRIRTGAPSLGDDPEVTR